MIYMLFRRRRRRPPRIVWRRYPISPHKKRKIKTLIAVLILLSLAAFVVIRLRELVVQVALYTVTDIFTQTINEAISKKINDGSLDYEDLITLEKDTDGNITALVTNSAKINLLQAEITNTVIAEISDQLATTIEIPLGNVLGSTIFSNKGPNIPVEVLSVTNSSAEFKNEFAAAGINQTRHQIMLSIRLDIELLVPGERVNTYVETEMVIAETVLVGDVPQTYALFN
jgi:sporulation protein YunB